MTVNAARGCVGVCCLRFSAAFITIYSMYIHIIITLSLSYFDWKTLFKSPFTTLILSPSLITQELEQIEVNIEAAEGAADTDEESRGRRKEINSNHNIIDSSNAGTANTPTGTSATQQGCVGGGSSGGGTQFSSTAAATAASAATQLTHKRNTTATAATITRDEQVKLRLVMLVTSLQNAAR